MFVIRRPIAGALLGHRGVSTALPASHRGGCSAALRTARAEGEGEPANSCPHLRRLPSMTDGFRVSSIAFAPRLRLGDRGRGTTKMRILGIVALCVTLAGCGLARMQERKEQTA